MSEMLCDLNQTTQPIRPYKVFNNWDVVAKGWYVACKSSDLKPGKAFSKLLCGHQIALFRTESGKASAVDAFCPHMGMDLGSGKVIGEELRCHFHHWKFDSAGKCTDIPCLKNIPEQRTSVPSYPVEEKYGFIWVYSDFTAPGPVFDIDGLKGKPILFTSLAPFRRIAHPHITMMNSIDEQHMRTVHKLDIDIQVEITETGKRFLTRFLGKVQKNTWVGRVQNFLFGDTYRSSVLFVDGCIGLLTTMIDVKLFKRFAVPQGHFLFSQTFAEKGQTVVYPIIIMERKKGIFGFALSWTLLMVHKVAMKFLAYQDGHVIYKALRFRQDGLLAGVDGPTAKWIAFVNSKIEPSIWSRARALKAAACEDIGAGSLAISRESTKRQPDAPQESF